MGHPEPERQNEEERRTATTAKVARHESDHARKLPSLRADEVAIVMPVTIRQTSREAWPGAARLVATMAPTPK